MNRWIQIGISLVVGIILAAVTSIAQPILGQDGLLNIAIGLLGSIATVLILEGRILQADLDRISDLLQEVGKSAELTVREAGLLRLGGRSHFGRGEALEAWHLLLQMTERSFLATNYTADLWEGASVSPGLLLQGARAQVSRMRVQRIFIIDDRSELEGLHRAALEHKDLGLEARWVMRREITKNKFVWDQLESGRLDFGVADDNWVFLTELDGNRSLTGVSIVRDAKLAQRLTVAFTSILGLSHPFSAQDELNLADQLKVDSPKSRAS